MTVAGSSLTFTILPFDLGANSTLTCSGQNSLKYRLYFLLTAKPCVFICLFFPQLVCVKYPKEPDVGGHGDGNKEVP